jgi:integrase/recombinase XerD
MKSELASPLGPAIRSYLSLKISLGRKYSNERNVLSHLDSFLASVGEDLNHRSYSGWIETQLHLTSGVRRSRMRIVRNLCLYRRRSDPDCFVPDLSEFPRPHQKARPYIFSKREIVRLLEVARQLRPFPISPLRAQNLTLGLILLYTAGLRRGELVRLTVRDYEPTEATLLVRESKFYKSRLLPLSSDAARAIEEVIHTRRDRKLPLSVDSPLLWSRYRATGTYSGAGFGSALQGLFRAAGIRTETGKTPRVHDLRHTFAVHALLRWYRRGEDVQAKLPALAAYMGHVSIVSTEYYLPFVTELAEAAALRFERRYGALIHGAGSDGVRP